MALLGEALSPGASLQSQELWKRNYDMPRSWVIDPVEQAAQAVDPRFLQVARELQEREIAAAGKSVDPGAVALDELITALAGRRVSNISGNKKPGSFIYPLEEGVYYRREPRESVVPGGRGTISEYVSFFDTPMMDWDLPDPSHPMASVTVRNLGDVEELARQYVQDNPESMLRLYQTPGGYRAWDLGVRGSPADMRSKLERALVDPLYLSFSEARPSVTHPSGLQFGGPGYSSRISAKPGRVDWVAQPVLDLRGRQALPDPVSLRRVQRFHDEPINRYYLNQGVSPDAMALLSQQLPTASESLRQEMRHRFGL